MFILTAKTQTHSQYSQYMIHKLTEAEGFEMHRNPLPCTWLFLIIIIIQLHDI